MKFKFDFSLMDIIKTISLITIIGCLWYYASPFINALKTREIIKEPELVYIEDNAVRLQFSESKAKVKELEKLLKSKNSVILKNVKDRKEKVDEIARIKGVLVATRKLHQSSDHVYLKGKKTDHHFIKIYNKASDGTEFPSAWAMFHPNQDDPEKLWKVGTFNQEFYVDIIETENRDGTFNRYVELTLENNKNSETKGKVFPVKIEKIDWAKNPIKRKTFSWNPRMSIMGVITSKGVYPGVALSMFSYGKTSGDIDWKFISIGAGGDDSCIYGFIEPASWNVGKILPLVENVFVGPVISINDKNNKGYGVGVSVPF